MENQTDTEALTAGLVEAYDVLYAIACQPPPAPWTREEILDAALRAVQKLLREHRLTIRQAKLRAGKGERQQHATT